jgi:hypothetical protein
MPQVPRLRSSPRPLRTEIRLRISRCVAGKKRLPTMSWAKAADSGRRVIASPEKLARAIRIDIGWFIRITCERACVGSSKCGRREAGGPRRPHRVRSTVEERWAGRHSTGCIIICLVSNSRWRAALSTTTSDGREDRLQRHADLKVVVISEGLTQARFPFFAHESPRSLQNDLQLPGWQRRRTRR